MESRDADNIMPPRCCQWRTDRRPHKTTTTQDDNEANENETWSRTYKVSVRTRIVANMKHSNAIYKFKLIHTAGRLQGASGFFDLDYTTFNFVGKSVRLSVRLFMSHAQCPMSRAISASYTTPKESSCLWESIQCWGCWWAPAFNHYYYDTAKNKKIFSW